MTLSPLVWDKVRAGEYKAADRNGNTFLIRRSGRDSATNKPIWVTFINDQYQTIDWKLSGAKRWVEAIGRKHSEAMKAS